MQDGRQTDEAAEGVLSHNSSSRGRKFWIRSRVQWVCLNLGMGLDRLWRCCIVWLEARFSLTWVVNSLAFLLDFTSFNVARLLRGQEQRRDNIHILMKQRVIIY
jgi:hypothetical protein